MICLDHPSKSEIVIDLFYLFHIFILLLDSFSVVKFDTLEDFLALQESTLLDFQTEMHIVYHPHIEHRKTSHPLIMFPSCLITSFN